MIHQDTIVAIVSIVFNHALLLGYLLLINYYLTQ
jgi:hypothetical protein